MKISQRLIITFSLIIMAVLLTILLYIVNSKDSKKRAVHTKEESGKFALLAKEMQIHCIQVQQWLTDISATRSQDGLNDGFDEAEKNAIGFMEKLKFFRDLYASKNDQTSLKNIEGIEISFNEFYTMGQKMAHEYINNGTASGNRIMREFDPFTEKIFDMVNCLVKNHVDILNSDMDQIIASNDKTVRRMFIIGITIIFFISILGFSLTKSIVNPVNIVLATMEKLGQGLLTVQCLHHSRDEIGLISNSVNSTILSLKDLVKEIISKITILASASEELSVVSEHLASNSEKTAELAGTVAKTTVKMSSSVKNMSSEIEEMRINTHEVASSAKKMLLNMEKASETVKDMISSINNINTNALEAKNISVKATVVSGNTTSMINNLSEAACKIGKVTNIIKSISQKTNLLSLNAAIEAASAGEAGKGFAIVANEIKNLADQSTSAAEDISKEIENMQINVSNSVKAISDITEIINQINSSILVITSSVNEQNEASNEISSNVGEALQSSKSIEIAIIEIAEGTNTISRVGNEAVNEINEIASNTASVGRETADSNQSIKQLKISANELTKMAGELNGLVRRFQV